MAMDLMYTTVRAIILLTLLTLVETNGEDRLLSRRKRVIGGTSIAEGERPWLVSLKGTIVTKRLFGYIPIKHKHVYCGGSLLNDQWVLTAAHCFDGGFDARDADSWEVRLAAVDLKVALADRFMNLLGKMFGREEWQTWEVDVKGIIIHPRYNRHDMWSHDIALVKLADNVPSGPEFEHIKRIVLPTAVHSRFPEVGNVCVVTGWGCTAAGGTLSRKAMSLELPVLSNRACKLFYRPRTMGGRLCAGFKPNTTAAGICPGDSGGPLVCRHGHGDWVQVGVASFTSRNNPGNFPAVFTRVSDFMYWINRYIGKS